MAQVSLETLQEILAEYLKRVPFQVKQGPKFKLLERAVHHEYASFLQRLAYHFGSCNPEDHCLHGLCPPCPDGNEPYFQSFLTQLRSGRRTGLAPFDPAKNAVRAASRALRLETLQEIHNEYMKRIPRQMERSAKFGKLDKGVNYETVLLLQKLSALFDDGHGSFCDPEDHCVHGLCPPCYLENAAYFKKFLKRLQARNATDLATLT